MTISTITIGGNDYISYASVAEADVRLAVDPVRAATWATQTTDQKGISLVAATNTLDLLRYGGDKTTEGQANQFPRSGLTDKDGVAVSTTEVPLGMQNAAILLAGTIAIDNTAAASASSGSNVKAVGAGSARVQFFRPTAGTPLKDETAYALIAEFLEGAASTGTTGSRRFGSEEGVEDASVFFDRDSFGLNSGWG